MNDLSPRPLEPRGEEDLHYPWVGEVAFGGLAYLQIAVVTRGNKTAIQSGEGGLGRSAYPSAESGPSYRSSTHTKPIRRIWFQDAWGALEFRKRIDRKSGGSQTAFLIPTA